MKEESGELSREPTVKAERLRRSSPKGNGEAQLIAQIGFTLMLPPLFLKYILLNKGGVVGEP